MRHVGGEKYFHIVTDPEDVPIEDPSTGRQKNPPPEEDTEPEENVLNDTRTDQEIMPVSDTDSEVSEPPTVTATKERHEPKRYVTVKKGPGSSQYLCADFVIKKNKRNTAFKLKNLVDDMTYSLSRSQWLPEASLGSQPYVICREGQSFLWGVKTVCLDEGKEGKVTYTENRRENYDNRLFILEHGRKT